MQQGNDRSDLHFFCFYFFTQQFRRSSYHQSTDENRNDDKDVKVEISNTDTSIK